MLKFIPLIALCLGFTSYAMDDEDSNDLPGSPLVRCPGFSNYNQQMWENDDSQGSTAKKPSSSLLVRSPGSKKVSELVKSQQGGFEAPQPSDSKLVRTRRTENLAQSQRDLTEKALEGSSNDNSGKTPITELHRQSTFKKPSDTQYNKTPIFFGKDGDLWTNPEDVTPFNS